MEIRRKEEKERENKKKKQKKEEKKISFFVFCQRNFIYKAMEKRDYTDGMVRFREHIFGFLFCLYFLPFKFCAFWTKGQKRLCDRNTRGSQSVC